MGTNQIIFDFPVTVYGNLEKYSDTLSKGRCRIFYKGDNRNGTFITDEFAEKLVKTLPYAPVKGIYEQEEQDFSDHGQARTEGRIYGVVPAEPNFAWEKFLDKDGVEREYACADVLYYTALYPEAEQIPGKSQSMELYKKSIKGDWKIINGKQYYVFEEGSFLGLQALGDNVEPCFEGAAFYTKEELWQKLVAEFEKLIEENKDFQINGQGGNTMGNNKPSITFRMSDGQKYDFLWNLLNPNVSEDGWPIVENVICEVYDDYAIVRNLDQGTFERVYYVKDDNTDSLEITKREACFIIDVNENEKRALDAIRALNNNTYELIDEKFSEIEKLNTEISENASKFEELNTTISTLTMERDEAKANNETLQAQIDTLNNDVAAITIRYNELAEYKKTVEDNAKQAVIDSYVASLSDEIIQKYISAKDEYTAEELDIRLTYEQKKAHPELFNGTSKPAYVPKEEPRKSGIEDILARYEKH